MATLAVILAVVAGPLAACIIAAVKGRNVVGWGAATLFVPLFAGPYGAWWFVAAVAFFVALVAVLPGRRTPAALAGYKVGPAQQRVLVRLDRRLRKTRAGDERRAAAAQELAALGTAPAARVLLDHAQRAQDPADPVWAALGAVDGQGVAAELCRAWDEQPTPGLEEVIRARGLTVDTPPRLALATGLLAGREPAIPAGERAAVLVELLGHGSDAVRRGARTALLSLKAAEDVDTFCGLAVAEPAEPELRSILEEAGYVAAEPLDVRLRSALLTGHSPFAGEPDAASVAGLAALWAEAPDGPYRRPALDALRGLQVPEQSDLLCDAGIEQAPGGAATAACLELELVPSLPARRAVFYVLTGRLDLYDGLDADGALLQAGYAEAGAPVAARLREALLHAGRSALLTRVLTEEQSPREREYSPGEAGFVVDQLVEKADWRRLAALLPALPVADALRAARAVDAGAGVEGGQGGDAVRLCELARQETLTPEDLAAGRVPALVRVASLRAGARINDLVFSPDQRHVAIALGARRAVVLWDHGSGVRDAVVRGFAHAVGRVAYGTDGRLYCAEKTSSTTEPCAVYTVGGDGRLTPLGAHSGSITALCPLDGGRLATTGRDEALRLWTVAAEPGPPGGGFRLPWWARQACVLPAGGRAVAVAVAADDVVVVDPGTGLTLAVVPLRKAGMTTALAVAPAPRPPAPGDGAGTLLAGTTSGAVLRIDYGYSAAAAGTPAGLTWTLGEVRSGPPAPPAGDAPPAATAPAGAPQPDRPRAAVAGLEWLDPGTLCVAWADGRLELLTWPGLGTEWATTLTVERVTSAAASPDGRLLAVGDGDTRSLLFDTWGRRLRGILQRPANACSPRDWSCVRSLRAAPDLPAPLANTLAFVDRLLENRFRHDVQLADEPVVVHGEFDIAIDDEGA